MLDDYCCRQKKWRSKSNPTIAKIWAKIRARRPLLSKSPRNRRSSWTPLEQQHRRKKRKKERKKNRMKLRLLFALAEVKEPCQLCWPPTRRDPPSVWDTWENLRSSGSEARSRAANGSELVGRSASIHKREQKTHAKIKKIIIYSEYNAISKISFFLIH